MSTQPFDKVEHDMGISSYMSTENSGFAAVLKARYSDFCVHEVNRNGKVARLESLVPDESMTSKPPQGESRKRKQPEPSEPLSMEQQWSRAQSGLSDAVGSEAATEAISLLQYWQDDESSEDASSEKAKFVVLPEVADKDARRALHQLIRSQLAFCALSDTQDGRVRIWHNRFEKEMANYGKFDRANKNNRNNTKNKWPSNRPDYLQFVLYKENMDTSFACKEVVRRVNQRKVRIGYAGMKDKRGVTTQFCTLYRQEPQVLAGINKGGGRGGGNTTRGSVSVLRVGNFEYVSEELSLGMLNGNRFDVALRNVDVSCEEGQDRITETKKCLQSAAVALRENGFINYFGMQRFGKYYDTHKVGLCLLKGDFEGAVDIILQPKPDEIPRYAMARERWAKRFDKLDENPSTEVKEKVERDCARDVLRALGPRNNITCEVSILNSLARKPCDYRRAFSCIAKTMRMMFLHAVQSLIWNQVASARIDKLGREVIAGDLVLVANKSITNGGSRTSGLEGKSVKVVDAEDVTNETYSMTDVVLPLVGTKIQYPENECGALFDSLLADQGITKKHFSKIDDRDVSLKGDYRNVVCKPTDVDFEIHEYTGPLQPLVKTDLMKLDGVELDVSKSKEDDKKKTVLLGMVIGFTLPPSSYATITLRELMRRPTSSDYQRQLKLEGDCEQAFSSQESQPDKAS